MDRPHDAAPLNCLVETDELRATKNRLRETSRAIDPLKPLREHPLLTVTSAATLGVVAGSPAAARMLRSTVLSAAIRGVISLVDHLRAQHAEAADAASADCPAVEGGSA